MKDKKSLNIILLKIVAYLVVIQVLLLGTKCFVFSFCEETLFSRSMVTMISMIIVFSMLCMIWKAKNTALAILPQKFTTLYCVATVFAVAFFLLTLIWIRGVTIPNMLMMFYGSVITPVFEELLFRGSIWNKLKSYIEKEWIVYLTVTVLFGLWHVGYAIGIYLWLGGDLWHCIMMKVLWGLLYGGILGLIRLKFQNCYLGILVHGVLNVFG